MMQFDFGTLLDAMPDAVVVADMDSRIVYCNSSVEHLLGWAPGELVGQSLHAIQPDRLHAAHDAGFTTYARTGASALFGAPIRVPARRRDGGEQDIELNLAEIHDAEGRRLVIGVLRDLSERVELERHLAVMHFLRATTAAAGRLWTGLEPRLVLQTLTDVLVDDFGAALARTWRYEPDANVLRMVTSGGLSTRVTGSSREVIDVATYPYKVGIVARTRTPFLRTGLLGDPDFDEDWVTKEGLQSVACLPLIAGGKLLGVMVAFFRTPLLDEVAEIIGHIAALGAAALNDADLVEQERAAHAAAEQARSEFELLARVSERIAGSLNPEATAEIVAGELVPELADWCVFDLLAGVELRMVAASHRDPELVQEIGRLRAQYPPRKDIRPSHPILRAVEQRATLHESVSDADLRSRAVDDAHLAMLRSLGIGSHVVVPLIARGRVIGTLSLIRRPERAAFDVEEARTAEDIGRRTALGIDNAVLYRSAQQAVALRDRFLAVASHELRTPLAVVRGNWELLERRLRHDEDRARTDMEPIQRRLSRGIDQLQRLVEDLLDARRIRGEASDLQPTRTDLVQLVGDAIAAISDPQQRGRVRAHLPATPMVGLWDATRLAQVVTNLLGNALKYSAPADPVDVWLSEAADDVHLAVRDVGIGIPARHLEVIFEPFERAPNAAEQHYPGLGLGLAVSREIVTQLGGRMWAESPGEGGGSTFHVEVPKAASSG